MKRIIVVLLSLVLMTISLGDLNVKAVESSKQNIDTEYIKEQVLKNCGLSDEWTTNIAVYGYVYGNYIYFTKNTLWTDQNIYRININNYKVEEYVKDVWHIVDFMDNYVVFNTWYTDNPKQGLYAKNLDTGKVIKIYNNSNTYQKYVKKYKDKFYYIKDVYDLRNLYSVNCDGTERKKIATRISDGEYAFYNDGKNNKLIYIRRYSNYTSKYYKIYSANLDGSDPKLLKKIKYEGTNPELSLSEQDGNVVLNVSRYNRELRKMETTLYLYNGGKFKKLGNADDNPRYATDRLEDGYRYRVVKSYNLDLKEYGRGLVIERQGLEGGWEVFTSLPFIRNMWNTDLEMHNGYLTIINSDGDHPYSATILDKNGDWILTEQIAGYTDETNMHVNVVGNKAYIIHGAVYCDENGNELDKYAVIDLDEYKKPYEEYGDVKLGDIHNKLLEDMHSQGLDYKPGSNDFNTFLKDTQDKLGADPKATDLEKFLLWMYAKTYRALFDEFVDVMNGDFYDGDELDIDEILAGNDCIVYDEETELFYFEISDSFLNLTIKDLVQNKVEK